MAHFGSPTVRHEKWMNSVEAVCSGGGLQSLRRRAVKIDKAPLTCVFIAADAFDVLWERPRLVAEVFAVTAVWRSWNTAGWGGFSMEGSKWSFTGSQRSPDGPRCHLLSWQADREGDREGRVSQAKWQTRQCDPIHQREGFITVLNTLMFSKARDWEDRVWGLTLGARPPCWSNSGHDALQRPEFSYSGLRGGSRQTERQCNTEDDVWHQA